MKTNRVIASGVFLVLMPALSACGGGGSAAPAAILTAAKPSAAPVAPASTSVAFTISVPPVAGANAVKRRVAYVSPSTQSISIAVNGSAPTNANLTNGSPNCTAPLNASPICTFDVGAPVGNDTFTVALYDAQNATGNVLSTKVLAQAVVANATNAITLALDGVVRRITIVPGTSALPAGATATTALAVNAFDAQANIIIGAGPYVDANGNALTINLASTQNQPTVTAPYTAGAAMLSAATVTSAAVPVTIAYDGKALLSSQFTATVSGGATIAPALATLNLTPTMYDYPAATSSEPFSIAVGPDQQIWVSLFNFVSVEHFVPPAPAATTLNATTFALPALGGDQAMGMAAGSDGNMWIASWGFDLFVCSPAGACTRVPVTGANHPDYLVDGHDGLMYLNEQYFTGPDTYSIATQTHQSGFGTRGGYQMFVGPDGRIWSTGGQNGCCFVPKIVAVPTLTSANQSITQISMDNDTTNVAVGPDGNIWFIQNGAGIVGHLASLTSSSQTGIEIHLAPGSGLYSIVAGPDGNMYFTDMTNNVIGRLPANGTTVADISDYPAPSTGANLRDLIAGPDGNVWFTESGVDRIGKLAL